MGVATSRPESAKSRLPGMRPIAAVRPFAGTGIWARLLRQFYAARYGDSGLSNSALTG
jgi:hypothetical protein